MKESVLVDSSIWIEALGKSPQDKIKTTLETLLLEQKVATTALIKLELLSGVSQESQFDRLSEELNCLRQLEFAPDIWQMASKLGFDLRRKGITVSNTDLLLAACSHTYQCPIWHQDQHFNLIAKHFDLKIFLAS